MRDDDLKRLSESDDDASAFLRDAIRDSKRDLPDETRLAAIALKLGPVIAGGAAGGGGAAAAGGAGAAKASAAPAAVKLGLLGSASAKVAAAVTALAIGGGVLVAPRVLGTRAQVTSAPTSMTSSNTLASASPTSANFSLPPASASALPTSAPTPTATMIRPPNPDDEVRNIERAQDALATDPKEALEQCNDDAIIFPHGALAQEREVIAIDALMRLGRTADARARAKKFEHDFPKSAALPHVRHLIGEN